MTGLTEKPKTEPIEDVDVTEPYNGDDDTVPAEESSDDSTEEPDVESDDEPETEE